MGVAAEQRWIRRCIEQNQKATDDARLRERLRMPKHPRKPVPNPQALPTRREVKAWMLRNADDCDEGCTRLVEAAAAGLDLPEQWLDDETHWLWDVAFEVNELRVEP